VSRFGSEKLNARAAMVLAVAESEANRLGADAVAPVHLLLGLMQSHRDVGRIFSYRGYSPESVRRALEVTRLKPPSGTPPTYSAELVTLVEASAACATSRNDRLTGTVHLFFALMNGGAQSEAALKIMDSLGFDLRALRIKASEFLRRPDATNQVYQAWNDAAGSARHLERVWKSRSPAVAALERSLIPNEVSTILTEKTKAIFRTACIYLERGSERPLAPRLKVQDLLCALADFGEPKYQLVLETLKGNKGTEINKLDVLFELQDLQLRGSKFEGVELSDAICELIRRVLIASTGALEPECFFSCLLCSGFDPKQVTLVEQVLSTLQPVDAQKDELQKADSLIDEPQSRVLVSPAVYRVFRRAKNIAAHAPGKVVMVSPLVHAWIAECRHSEPDFSLTHEHVLKTLFDYCETNLKWQSPSVTEQRVPRFDGKVQAILHRARREASLAEVDRISINHIGIGIIDSLAKDKSFEESTALSPHHLIQLLQLSVLPTLGYSRSGHNAVAFPLSELDDHVLGPFWPAPLNLDATKMSRFELFEMLSFRSELVVQFAVREAIRAQYFGVNIEDVFTGLLCETLGPTYFLFRNLGISATDARGSLSNLHVAFSRHQKTYPFPDSQAVQLLEIAWKYARRWRDTLIEPEHILLAMTKHPRGLTALSALELEPKEVTRVLGELMLEERRRVWSKRLEKLPVLHTFQPEFWQQILRKKFMEKTDETGRLL
jgi:hypothetical protein